MKHLKIFALLLAAVLLLTVAGCSAGQNTPGTGSSPTGADIAEPAKPDTAADTGRSDGERFEKIIMIEGTEETVMYEHVISTAAGVALDYEYETLKRQSYVDSETFVSVYDDPDAPVNFITLTASEDDADTAAADYESALGMDFADVKMEPTELENSGWCTRITASSAKDDESSYALCSVYIIPATDGCRIAFLSYTIESAEGFGARFLEMLNTLEVING